MTQKIELEELEKWSIVENLMGSYYELEEMGHQDTATQLATTLDKISPNWRDANSCKAVEFNRVVVEKATDSGESSE